MEVVDQVEVNVMQVGLFDMGVELLYVYVFVDEFVWDDKCCLQEEKVVFGFYLFGYLFDVYCDEVWCFVWQKVGDLKEGCDKFVVGIIVLLCMQMMQCGKMLIVLFDDGMGQCEIMIFNEQFEVNKVLFKEDELLIVQGQVCNDVFIGGICFMVDIVMDFECVCSCYVQVVWLMMNGNVDVFVLCCVFELYVLKDDLVVVNVIEVFVLCGGGCDGGWCLQVLLLNGFVVQIYYSNVCV